MTKPEWMPDSLADRAFSVDEADRRGLSRGRRDASALERPYTGVRSVRPAADAVERARQYLPRMRDGQAFSGVTALRIWGLPWRLPWRADEVIELAVPLDRYAPRSRGVRGRRLLDARLRVTEVDRLRVLTPAAALMTVVERLELDEVVALMDALVTESSWYPRLRLRPALPDIESLAAEVEAWGGSPERHRARRGLPLVRKSVDSFPESIARIAFFDGGLPMPDVQVPIPVGDDFRFVDGGWPEFRVCFQYEGEHHRTDPSQWDSDILRDEDAVRAGWHCIRITKQSLRRSERAGLVARAARALRSAGWSG